jgi:hypothetical protein
MGQVHIQLMAFDKNSSECHGLTIVADNKEDFNNQVEEFENSIPYTKYYIELIATETLTEEQEKIVEDHYIV